MTDNLFRWVIKSLSVQTVNTTKVRNTRFRANTGTAKEHNISLEGISIVHTDEVMDMHDTPTEILKSKKNTSLGLGLQMVAEGKGDAFVSAGSTGALLVGATLIVKRIKGIKRPALATAVPTPTGKYLLLDCGANADCRPEMLMDFALMGNEYMAPRNFCYTVSYRGTVFVMDLTV